MRRLRAAAPSWKFATAGALAWAALMAASAATSLLREGWQAPERILEVALVFAAGAAIAFPIAMTLANLVAGDRRAEGRFAACLLALLIATITATSGLYAMDYRMYYAQWHADAFSITWMFQFVFTTLGAIFQFSVAGARLYFPLGFIGLLATAGWFALRRH